MSLTASLSSAISGLNVAQRGISVVSDNVANVNTEGYARKEITQVPLTIAGQAAGVNIAEVRRVTDEFLNRESRIATAEFNRFESAAGLQEQAVSLLGDPTGDRNLVALLDKVLVEVGTLAANPETTAVRSSAVETLNRLTEDIDRLSDGVRDLRRQADQRVGQRVDDANLLMEEIHDLNQRINAQAGDATRASLEDQRGRKLDELSEIVDIQTSQQSNGTVFVSTTGGLPLIDQNLRQFVHGGANAGDFGEVHPPIALERVETSSGNRVTVDSNIDDRILSGELKGLLETRDGALNDMALELGAFSASVTDEMNRVHNAFTAVPPPASLSGNNMATLTTDPHGFTGNASFHTFDASNNIVATATIDFGAIGGTVGDVLTAVNAGLGGTGTLSVTNGVMSFTAAGAATGVGIAQDASTPSDANGRGFSHRYGLNDLLRSQTGPHFETGLQAGTAHGFTGTADFQLVGPQNQRPVTTTIDFATFGGTVGDLVNQLNTDFNGVATFGLDAAGKLTATPATGLTGFSIEVTDDQTERGTSGRSVSEVFGLGSAPLSKAAAGLAVRSDIVRSPERMALAEIDATGNPAVAIGDNAGAVALQSLNFVTSSFESAGRLPDMTGTLSELGGELLGRAGQAAREVQDRAVDREALKEDLFQRVGEVSGVNIDEEMADLIQLQAAFNAATRVISATNEMIDELLRL